MIRKSERWDDLVQIRERGEPRPDVLTVDSGLHIVSCPRGHGKEYRALVIASPVESVAFWREWMRRRADEARCRTCGAAARTVSLRVAVWLPGARRELLLSLERDQLSLALHKPGDWTVEITHDDPVLAELGAASFCRAALSDPTASVEHRIEALQDVLMTFGEYAPALRELARTEHQASHAHEARQLAERALNADAGDPESWFVLGAILTDTYDSDGALFAYACCLALDPTNADAWNRRGVVLSRVGRVADAADAHTRALEASPGHPSALHELARLCMDGGDCDGALQHLETLDGRWLDRDDPLRASILETITVIAGRSANDGNWAGSLRAHRAALRIDDQSPATWFDIASCHANLGEWHEALVAARRTLALAPKWPGARAILARCGEHTT